MGLLQSFFPDSSLQSIIFLEKSESGGASADSLHPVSGPPLHSRSCSAELTGQPSNFHTHALQIPCTWTFLPWTIGQSWMKSLGLKFSFVLNFCRSYLYFANIKKSNIQLVIVRQFRYLSCHWILILLYARSCPRCWWHKIKAWGVWSRRRNGHTGWGCLKLLIAHTHHLQIARHSSVSERTFPNTSKVIIFNHTLPAAFQ